MISNHSLKPVVWVCVFHSGRIPAAPWLLHVLTNNKNLEVINFQLHHLQAFPLPYPPCAIAGPTQVFGNKLEKFDSGFCCQRSGFGYWGTWYKIRPQINVKFDEK